MTKRLRNLLILLPLHLTLPGCLLGPNTVAIHQGTVSPTQPPDASLYKDQALIYFYREQTLLGGAVTMPVQINGKLAGALSPHCYFFQICDPGEKVIHADGSGSHKMSIVRQNDNQIVYGGALGTRVYSRVLKMNAAAGEIYYVRVSYGADSLLEGRWAWTCEAVTEARAQQDMKGLSLVTMNRIR